VGHRVDHKPNASLNMVLTRQFVDIVCLIFTLLKVLNCQITGASGLPIFCVDELTVFCAFTPFKPQNIDAIAGQICSFVSAVACTTTERRTNLYKYSHLTAMRK